jgi:hypothetical protein
VRDPQAMKAAAAGCEVVYHLVGKSHSGPPETPYGRSKLETVRANWPNLVANGSADSMLILMSCSSISIFKRNGFLLQSQPGQSIALPL